MRRLLWLAAWSVVAVWSLFAFLAYGFVDMIGGLAMRNADLFSSNPETVERIWRVFSWIHSISTSIALVVWGGISLLILSVPWVLDRMAGRGAVVGRGGGEPIFRRPPPDGVIDLPPDQYSVRSTAPANGSVQHIRPRG